MIDDLTYYKIIEGTDTDVLVAEPASEYGLHQYTYADYLLMKIEERVELFKGRILKMSAPNRFHQSISREIAGIFYIHLKNKKCQTYSAPFDVRLPLKNKKNDDEITTVVQPDIVVVCDESKLDDKGCCGAPELVVEILSPSNSKRDIKLKFDLYEEVGVLEYWIVNPEMESVIIYHLQNGKFVGSKFYVEDDIISSTIIEGLTIEAKEIFKK